MEVDKNSERSLRSKDTHRVHITDDSIVNCNNDLNSSSFHF
jgi:hypothetical protein